MDLRGNEGGSALRYVVRRRTFASVVRLKTAELVVHSYIRSLITTGYNVLCGIPQFLGGFPTPAEGWFTCSLLNRNYAGRFRYVALCNYIPPSTTSHGHTGCSGTFFPPCRATNKTLNTSRSSGSTPSTSNKENHPQRPGGN